MVGKVQKKTPDKSIHALLIALKQELIKLYGSRLKGLVVFGSYARGQARPGSDLDVAMLLEDMERPWPEIRCTGSIVADLSLKYGITVSLIPLAEHELTENASPLVRSIRREGIQVP